MPSSATALDFSELHLNKFLEPHYKLPYNSTFHHDLLKAQTALENEEKKLLSKKKPQLKKNDIPSPSPRNNAIPISNNAPIPDDQLSSTRNKTSNQTHSCPINQDDKLITQLFNHINRPLPEYLRPRQLNTKEWFLMQSNNILLN